MSICLDHLIILKVPMTAPGDGEGDLNIYVFSCFFIICNHGIEGYLSLPVV